MMRDTLSNLLAVSGQETNVQLHFGI